MDLLKILEQVKSGELTPLEAQDKILAPITLPEHMPQVKWFKAWKINHSSAGGHGYATEEACLQECNNLQYPTPIYLT